MNEELALPAAITVPGVGTLVRINNLDEVTQALQDVRTLEGQLRDAKAVLTAAVVQESQRQGTKTLTAAGVTVTVSPDTEIVWDMTVLPELLDAGLPPDRYNDLVEEVVTYKVNGTEARKLEGANPVYAAIIGRARVRQPKRQYATVKT
jgi:hypothetical protein